jgi:Spy/CpxP family protein refolding chaperone
MSTQTRVFALMLLITAITAAFAGWVGVQYGMRRTQNDLDTVMHERLHLTPVEEMKIAALEKGYGQRRAALQAQMDAANRDLADVITHDHTFGTPEAGAVNRFHDAMKILQIETIKHVLAMRAVLTPHQAEAFDALVAEDLTKTTP